jgi:hypothetical protein
MPRPISPEDGNWLNGVQARQIIGCAASALQRAAMLGQIRVKLFPGCPPRYSRVDVKRFAKTKSRTTAPRQEAVSC